MADTAPKHPAKIQEILADTYRFARRELAFSFANRLPGRNPLHNGSLRPKCPFAL